MLLLPGFGDEGWYDPAGLFPDRLLVAIAHDNPRIQVFLEPFGRQTKGNPNEKICVWVRRHRQRGELVQLTEIEAAVILPRRPIHVVDVLSGVRYEREGVRAVPTKLGHVARMEIKRRVSAPVHRFAILEKGG